MRLIDAKRKAVQLIREWSANGIKRPEGEIADYLISMDDLADMAQKQIATRKKIHTTYEIEQVGVSEIGYNKYNLPDDYYQLNKIVYENEEKGLYGTITNYLWEGKKTLVIPKQVTGKYVVHYYRMPQTIQYDDNNKNKNDNYEFEVDEDAQELIPLYLAACVLVDEEIGIATQKLNEYYSRLAELKTEDLSGINVINNITGW